jgi:hypothetical protein
VRLEQIANRYADDVAFFIVYIREAHASDGWQMRINEIEDVIFADHKSMDDRVQVAQACAIGLDIGIPMLLDEMTDEVNQAYSALPDRLYLIDADGRVAYRSGPGPWGFDPEEFDAAIRSHLEAR